MPGPEAKIERAVVQWWRAHGFMCVKLKKRGWPDHLFIGEGNVHVYIEFKTARSHTTPLQDYTISLLRGLSCKVYVVRHVEEAKEILLAELATARLSAERD